MLLKSYEERVATGAALLDRKKPGWYKYIDSSTLSLSSNRKCVLGQMYGHYWTGIAILKINGHSQGFVVYRFWDVSKVEQLWREQITSRRAKDLNRQRILSMKVYASNTQTRITAARQPASTRTR